jgi:hypothetical protein
VIIFQKGARDVFRRTADHPIERYAVLLGQIIALLERVDDRENSASICKKEIVYFLQILYSTPKVFGHIADGAGRSVYTKKAVSWLAD